MSLLPIKGNRFGSCSIRKEAVNVTNIFNAVVSGEFLCRPCFTSAKES